MDERKKAKGFAIWETLELSKRLVSLRQRDLALVDRQSSDERSVMLEYRPE